MLDFINIGISLILLLIIFIILLIIILFRKGMKKLQEFRKDIRQVQVNLFEHFDTPLDKAHKG